MVPCGHFLAYTQVLEVTLFWVHFTDFVIPSRHITLRFFSH